MRVAVVGSSGAGKSTLGRQLASRIGAPHVELDAIYHQANWTPLDDEEFRRRVQHVVAGERWVVDGNYSIVRPLVLARATHVAWLDLPRPLIMSRVIRRSVSRAVTRRPMWNGNRESVLFWFRDDHPIRWSWSNYQRKVDEYEARFADPEHVHLDIARLRSPLAVRTWLASIAPDAGT